jgi:hypothetical protein
VAGIGFLVLFAGYALFAQGWGQIHSCTNGIVGVFWPGSYKGCNPDQPSSGGGGNANNPIAKAANKGGIKCINASMDQIEGLTPCPKAYPKLIANQCCQ